ncbi:MAG TPA: glycoside hydrolase family 6 protein [Polyangiaceae bacterium]|nr:glycoside hydrolase family 6 protein [Polyangiaceae bacterium]
MKLRRSVVYPISFSMLSWFAAGCSGTDLGGLGGLGSLPIGTGGSTSAVPGATGGAPAAGSPGSGAVSSGATSSGGSVAQGGSGNTGPGPSRGGTTGGNNPPPGGTGATSSSSGGSNPGTGTAGPRVDNPYAGVKGYVNPEWKAKADAEPGGSRVSDNPTGVWMDRIAAIAGTGSSSSMGLRDHLDAALAQGAGYIQVVIYNLPGRDCAALSSNGELGPTEIDRYQHEYIDPIAEIMSDAKYQSLRLINIIEIDSLPNLVTNTGSSKSATAACDVMKANGNYQKGIQYALGKLHKIPNTYNYVDAGHHGWIGWEENFNNSAQLFAETAKGAEGGVETVQGFITNTANYSALQEPYIKVTEQTRLSKWIDYNQYVDELSFAKAFRSKLVSLGFSSSIGMLIDTSRNGWGGPNRPTQASTASDVNTMIDESRIDRRFHLGNWCNQAGAGLGERPKVVGSDGIDAYVWIKPPGESDGASMAVENDQGKGVDGMCDPTYGGNARNGNNKSGALGSAPLSGAWFSAQFRELMDNAYPPL